MKNPLNTGISPFCALWLALIAVGAATRAEAGWKKGGNQGSTNVAAPQTSNSGISAFRILEVRHKGAGWNWEKEELNFVSHETLEARWRLYYTKGNVGKARWRLKAPDGSILKQEYFDPPADGYPLQLDILMDGIEFEFPPKSGEYQLIFSLHDKNGNPLGQSKPDVVILKQGANDEELIGNCIEWLNLSYSFPALAGAIVPSQTGNPIVATHGVREWGKPLETTATDKWAIGSCTKAMTATLVGILAQKGVIQWGQTVWNTFPELQSEMAADYQFCTFKHLAAHRSGIEGHTSAEQSELTRTDIPAWQLRHDFAASIVKRDPAGFAGGKYSYQNANYILIAAMLERLTNVSYEDLMWTELFEPLGMTSAGWGPPAPGNRALGPVGHLYESRSGGFTVSREFFGGPAVNPAGYCHMSLQDWAKFVRLHMNGAEGNLTLFSPTLEELHTPFPDRDGSGKSYGWGWGIKMDPEGGVILTHAGDTNNFYSKAAVFLNRGFAVLASTNVGGNSGRPPVDNLIMELAYGGSNLPEALRMPADTTVIGSDSNQRLKIPNTSGVETKNWKETGEPQLSGNGRESESRVSNGTATTSVSRLSSRTRTRTATRSFSTRSAR